METLTTDRPAPTQAEMDAIIYGTQAEEAKLGHANLGPMNESPATLPEVLKILIGLKDAIKG